MSERSDIEDSESESSTNTDLEVQLYSLVHYATDSLDAVATESAITETNRSLNQQDSSKEFQVSSTLSVQNSSETVNASSDHLSATVQNEVHTKNPKTWKQKSKKPEKVVDYLTLLKEYKTAKAQQNFAEMSRNSSLLWFHKQQNLAKGYRKRYWMKETSDQSDNVTINHNSDTPFHVFNNNLYSDNRNEENSFRKSAPESTDAFITEHLNGYTAFPDPGVTEHVGTSAAKKSRSSKDTTTNNINPNINNYESPFKKKKRKRRHKKSIKNTSNEVSSRYKISNSSKLANEPNNEYREEQHKEVQENHATVHTSDKNINDDIDSRYNIAPSKKEIDVIVLDSSDSESSIIVLGSPPPPEPPPEVCLDSDGENLKHQPDAAVQQQLMLNVATPKQLFREKFQENNKLTEGNSTKHTSAANKAVASSSKSRITSKARGHQGANDCRKWTAEMISYYNESWGGEHFDVISLQHQMSNNPVKWHVSQRDFQAGFYYKRHKDKCTNCSQFGHSKWHCPEPPRPVCCKMCGEQGHTEPRCPFPICLQCGERTMVYVRSCRNCRNKTYCTVCNKSGHSHDTCPEVWRKYCTTTSLLQVNRAHGPVYKPKEQQWCCVCAKKGHFPEDCQPFYVEPITFQINNEIHTPNAKSKKKKKYMEFRKRKVHFGMPC